MRRLSKDELAVILSEHAKWMADSATGKRAEISEYEITNELLPNGVVLRYCTLSYCTVSDCTLCDCTLSDCTVSGGTLSYCTLSGGTLSGGTVSSGTVRDKPFITLKGYSGLYPYNVWAVLFKDGSCWVRMGCLFKSLEQWEAKGGIRNSNVLEFPDDGSDKCEERVAAFEFAKAAALRMKA